ncbi:MAG: BNR-4 repeat-containing protein [Prolixibacteraceae bacterium]
MMKRKHFTLLLAFSLSFYVITFGQVNPDVKMSDGKLINQKANGFKGIWYMNQPSNDEYVYKYSGGMAVYPANHRPFAIYSKKADKTFFCFGGTDEKNSTLLHSVSYFDHKTGKVANPTIVLDKGVRDAHDNPVISMDDQGYIWIFSTSHGAGRPSYISKSKEPYNIDSFELTQPTEIVGGKEVPFTNFSYFQVYHIKKKGFITLFTKYIKNRRVIGFNTSADGIKWNEWKQIANYGEGHYQVSDFADGKIGVAFDFHPNGKGLNWRTNLQYLETKDFGKSWQTASGETAELPLTETDNPALVHDFVKEKLNCYLSDIELDKKGNPAILIISSKGFESGPENGPRVWHLFTHGKHGWNDSQVTTSDNNYDMGSVYIESGKSWKVIGPSVDGPQAFNTGGEVTMWTSSDKGKSWTMDTQMTKNSPRNHCYVRRPLNVRPDFYGIWADGHGRKPSESHLYICNKKGEVFVLPRESSEDMISPVKKTFK